MDPIVNSLKSQANTVCRNHISEEYIHNAFKDFKWGYYYKQDNNVVGFCIWKEFKENVMNTNTYFKSMFVLLVCAQSTDYKLGKIMFFDMETFALQNNYNTIKMQPLNTDIVPYYETLGYKISLDNKYFFMEKTIRVFRINKNLRNSKTRKQKPAVPFIIKNKIDILDDQ
jgi:hypothetical protein